MGQYRVSTSKNCPLWGLVCAILICLLLAAPGAKAANPLLGFPTASQHKSDQDQSEQTLTLNQLANLLANDKTRQQLISELRQAAKQEQGGPAKAENNKPAPAKTAQNGSKETTQQKPSKPQHEESFARQFADHTAGVAEVAGGAIAATKKHLKQLASGGPGGQTGAAVNWDEFFQAVLVFAVVAVATVVSFLVLRLLAGFVFARIARLPERSATRRKAVWWRTLAVVAGVAIDIAVVFIAGGIGYAVGLYGVGDHGAIGTRQSLFINAFILIELIKVVVRAVFSAQYENLRPVRIAPEIAAWWSIRLRWFVGVIGYALLVAVPIVNEQLGLMAGAVVSFIVMAGAYIYALNVIFRNHRVLTARLRNLADKASLGFFAALYRLFARIWMFLALVYFTVLFVTSQLYPQQVLPAMLRASVETLVAAAVCFTLSGLLSRLIGRRIAFSEGMRERLPLLEARLNSYVPNTLKVIRVIILILFVAATLNIWDIFDFSAWVNSDVGFQVISTALHVLLILAIAVIAWVVIASLIENRMTPHTGRRTPSARQQTLLTLFRNTVAIVIVGFTIMIILSQIGVNIGPLIAGAGVFGLAIGFGAQSLVHDIITGVFIQLENAMNTGDVVNLSGTWGTVERITIRSVSLRDIDGGFHIIPFSSVSVVSNYMREFAYHRFEYRVSYRENIDDVIVHLREAFDELKADPEQGPNILEDMTVPGVTTLDEHAIKIRIMIKTVAGSQWGVGRAFNRLVKIHFDRAGIEIPYPQQTIYFGEDRKGHASSAKIRLVDAEEEEAHRTRYWPRRRWRSDDEAPEETGDAPG